VRAQQFELFLAFKPKPGIGPLVGIKPLAADGAGASGYRFWTVMAGRRFAWWLTVTVLIGLK
jgi:hypothetical protein